MWSAARSAKISMILCMPERVSGGDAKFQGFCDRWNKWEGQPFYLVIRYGVVAREEAYLEREFGDAYLTYKARVRRWL